MLLVRCTLITGVLAAFLSLAALVVRLPEGNGFVSQDGATIFTLLGVFIFAFGMLWFPSLTIGYFVKRKGLSKRQKIIYTTVILISAIVFFNIVSFIGHTILHPR